MKKSYHSNMVPRDEAPMTIGIDCFLPETSALAIPIPAAISCVEAYATERAKGTLFRAGRARTTMASRATQAGSTGPTGGEDHLTCCWLAASVLGVAAGWRAMPDIAAPENRQKGCRP